jgi:hypothetical protein
MADFAANEGVVFLGHLIAPEVAEEASEPESFMRERIALYRKANAEWVVAVFLEGAESVPQASRPGKYIDHWNAPPISSHFDSVGLVPDVLPVV